MGVNRRSYKRFKRMVRRALTLGVDPKLVRPYFRYRRQRSEWLAQGGKITKTFMILQDYADTAGTVKGHYFHQDLLVAGLIAEHNPRRHVDVGSRVDGFVAHVASFREIEVFDIRPLPKSAHCNIRFVQADLMNPSSLGRTDSLSCLHTIEHFGLGRYTDPVDVNGHLKGIDNLVSLVEPGGRFYISFPIGKDNEVHFNAHRVFHPEWLLSVPTVQESLRLARFDFVDDQGDLHKDAQVQDAIGAVVHGCGIYTFELHPGPN